MSIAKKDKWARRRAYAQRRHDRCIRNNLAPIPVGARAVKLVERRNPAVFYIITLSAYPAENRKSGEWQATRFDDLGPCSHFNAPSIESAVRALTGERLNGPPYAEDGQLMFHSAI